MSVLMPLAIEGFFGRPVHNYEFNTSDLLSDAARIHKVGIVIYLFYFRQSRCSIIAVGHADGECCVAGAY